MAYFDVTPNGLLLKEIAKDVTVEDVRKATGCPFEVAKDLKVMPVDL
jgi:acyl CoA:acetate/3-ketoacid CoA transferase beta subunit